jgi:hypothetical protein
MNARAAAGILLGWRINIESLLESLDEGCYLRLHVSNSTAFCFNKYKKSDYEVFIPINDWDTISLVVEEECSIGFAPSTPECSVYFQGEYHECWGLGFWVPEVSLKEIHKLSERLINLIPKLRLMLPNIQIEADQIKLMADVQVG